MWLNFTYSLGLETSWELVSWAKPMPKQGLFPQPYSKRATCFKIRHQHGQLVWHTVCYYHIEIDGFFIKDLGYDLCLVWVIECLSNLEDFNMLVQWSSLWLLAGKYYDVELFFFFFLHFMCNAYVSNLFQWTRFYGTVEVFCIHVCVCPYLLACIYAHTRVVCERMWCKAAASSTVIAA